MKRHAQAFLFAALVLFVAPACSPFTSCVKPYTSQFSWTGTITELGDVVGAFLLCDPTFNGGDAPVCALESLNQLETTLGPDGKAIIDCIVAYYEGNGTAKQQAAAKAVGVKRGVNRSALRCQTLAQDFHANPGDRLPGTSAGRVDPARAPAAAWFSYAGPNPGASLAHCERACGDNAHGAIAPPGGCECWRRVGSTWRWVALRDAPGAGMVATR